MWHVWMKLSAPYRCGDDPLASKPDPHWLKVILAHARERCVWGSDWPHTPPQDEQKGGDIEAAFRKISYNALVDNFLGSLGDDKLACAIMEENPARLYGYPDAA
jgi:predicted TIM-barrel fold metal-dependent hydrolase